MHSPRIVMEQRLQQRQPASAHSSAHSLQAPPSSAGTGCQGPRISVPGAPPGGLASGEEVQHRAPSFGPLKAQPVGANAGQAPRRAHGGSQPLQPQSLGQRQFGSNVSPRVNHRESKPGYIVAEHTPTGKLDFGDKENCDGALNRDHIPTLKLQDPAAVNSEHLAMAFAEHSARLGKREQEVAELELQKQSQLQMVQEENKLQHAEMRRTYEEQEARRAAEERHQREELRHSQEERLRQVQHAEQQRLEKQKEELRTNAEERNILLDRIGKLEKQNVELQHSLSQTIQQKQSELDEKDRRLHEADCEVHRKDVQLQKLQEQLAKFHETECLMHDKDQTLQQMKHEHQQQEASLHTQLLSLQAELQTLQKRHQEDQDDSQLAEQEAAAEHHRQEKENRALWQKVHDQKSLIRDLESSFKRTWSVGNFITPGDFNKMVEKSEARNGLSVINHRQICRITELETLQALHEKEMELHCRHLPAHVIAADKNEAAEIALEAEDTSENDFTRPEPSEEPQLTPRN